MSWLNHYNNDIIQLMRSLRLDADEKDLDQTSELYENVLGVIFR